MTVVASALHKDQGGKVKIDEVLRFIRHSGESRNPVNSGSSGSFACTGVPAFLTFYGLIKNQFLIFPLTLFKILPVTHFLSPDPIYLRGRGQAKGDKRAHITWLAGVERNRDCGNRLEGP
jgi:hypothetical protein